MYSPALTVQSSKADTKKDCGRVQVRADTATTNGASDLALTKYVDLWQKARLASPRRAQERRVGSREDQAVSRGKDSGIAGRQRHQPSI